MRQPAKIYWKYLVFFALFTLFGLIFWHPYLELKAKNLSSPAEEPGQILGKVTDESGNAISGIGVSLTEVATRSGKYTTTDSSGNYSFTNLPLTSYTICSLNSPYSLDFQYLHECYNNKLVNEAPTAILLSSQTPVRTNINLVLSTGAHISGRVTNEAGQPIADVVIRTESAPIVGPDGSYWYINDSDVSDANGEYLLTGLAANSYQLCAYGSNNGYAFPYFEECYNNAATINNAQKIPVLHLQQVTGIDFQLVKGGMITGTVTNKEGKPALWMSVQAYKLDSAWIPFRYPITIRSDGTYAIVGLPAGSYRLGVADHYFDGFPYIPEFYQDAARIEDAQSIRVELRQTISNTNFQLSKYSSIQGKVTDQAGKPLQRIGVTGEIWQVSQNIGSWQPLNSSAMTDSSGVYTLTGLSGGKIRLRFSEIVDYGFEKNYTTEYYNDSFTVEGATPITVPTDAAITGINAQLATCGSIAGIVVDENNQPLSQIAVTSNIKFGCCWQYFGSEFVTQADGAFEVRKLDNGNYQLCFNDRRSPIQFAAACYSDISVLGGNTSRIVMQMPRPAAIEGTVTSVYGLPIANAIVMLQERRAIFGGFHSISDLSHIYTGGDGYFRFDGLRPQTVDREYIVGIQYIVGEGRFVPEYYNSQPDAQTATPITVTLGHTETVNIQLDFYPDYNAPPLARDDYLTVTRGESSSLLLGNIATLLANDQDAENAPLQATLVSDPLNGSLILNSDGTFTYTHNGSATTSDSLTYQASDGVNQSNVATVLITVTDAPPVNTSPIAQNDAIRLIRGASSNRLTDGASTLLANDVDAENAPLQAILVTNPVNGALTLNANGTFTYTHNGSATTSDSFTYQASDGINLSNIATVTISITDVPPVNLPPIANPDALNVIRGGQSSTLIGGVASVIANDQDAENGPLQAILVANPVNGTLTLNATGTFTYTHNGSVTTSDSFTYQANDGVNQSNVSTVTITITAVPPVNTPPVANPDALTVDRGGQSSTLTGGTISLLANDQDAENSPLQARIVTNPINGTLTLNANGTFTYTHDGSVTTSDSFTYQASDGVNRSNVSTVTITITAVPPVNTPPVANPDVLAVDRGGQSSTLTGGGFSLLANDQDAENSPLQAILVANPLNGVLTLNANGTFTYKHNNSKTTSDLFTYRASDGVNQSNVATVTITIKPLVSFEFSKTVSILGIEPACGAVGTMKVPVTTTINYCYSITNSDDVTLTTHSLVDDKLGNLLNNAAITLAPGATHRVQFSQTLTVNTTNIATWTATSNVAGLTAAELESVDVAQAIKQATITISAPTDDQDGDTIPDNLESAGDADGDNLPNFLDTDANGNGTPDASEAGANPLAPVDSNGNGVPDYLDLTAPNEGQNTKKVYLPVVSR